MKRGLEKLLSRWVVTVLFGIFVLPGAGWGDYAILHRFACYPTDGGKAYGSLVYKSNYFYGMTSQGGGAAAGIIFKINTNGNDYEILHSFSGDAGGGTPFGNLVMTGSTLYGMTSKGGDDGVGVIFKINTDGSDYTVLHSFSQAYTDGSSPRGSLIISGVMLYGMTYSGGTGTGCAQRCGTVFSLNTSLKSFKVLHSFTDAVNDGTKPSYGSLMLSGSTLYGMTSAGGAADGGVVFKVGVTGSGFAVLHSFGNEKNEGYAPLGSLVLSGSTLFGMTSKGGAKSFGTIFRMDTNGDNYAVLHSFPDMNVTSDGYTPYGSLILWGDALFGMASNGGGTRDGVIFKISADGGGYEILHRFGDGTVADDGGAPYGDPTLVGTTLYGMTSNHSTTSYVGCGVIYALTDVVVTVPGAPRAAKATAGNRQATVSFKAPVSNGGCPIISYEAISNPGNIKGTGKKAPLVVKGLTNGKTYTFTVKASNKMGTGPASAKSNSVIPIGPPGAPRAVKATAGNKQATVSFKAPSSNGGSPITSYEAISNPGKIKATGKKTRLTVKGLTNGKTYTFNVRAVNAAGAGPWSPKSNAVVPKH